MTHDAEQLQQVLISNLVPWGYFSRGGGQRVVYVTDLLRCVHEAGFQTDEDALDTLVTQVGGRKELAIVDLWDIPYNAVRKLVGRPPKYSQPAYIFPPSV